MRGVEHLTTGPWQVDTPQALLLPHAHYNATSVAFPAVLRDKRTVPHHCSVTVYLEGLSQLDNRAESDPGYCRGLFAKIDDINPHACTDQMTSPNKSYSMTDLLEIEQWPECNAAKFMPAEARQLTGQSDFFACHICLKILSADRFSNAMMK
ncbi:hypothetical protein V501_02424, partial [Pseudogymnoascus sp. VKM F-4519 (FW-2642)]